MRARGCRVIAGLVSTPMLNPALAVTGQSRRNEQAGRYCTSRGSRPSIRYRRPRHHPDHGGAGARRRGSARPHREARTRGVRSATSGTTRPAPRRSPASSPTPRASCAASRSCGNGSTTCRCSTSWPPRRRAQATEALAEADAELEIAARGHRGDGGAHAAVRRVRRARGAASPSGRTPVASTPPTGPRC